MSKKKYRYPGVNYFKTSDHKIFCGRQDDVNKFYKQIMLSDTMILHAESGIGKSSLIRAGIIPLIKNETQYFPVIIRFETKSSINGDEENEEKLIESTIEQIKIKFKEELTSLELNNLPFVDENLFNNSLWCLNKAIEKKGHKLLLIFDQFEEIQTFSIKQLSYFKENLSQLLLSGIPENIDNIVDDNFSSSLELPSLSDKIKKSHIENINFLETDLSTKIVFVIREDKLGTMSSFSDYFPDILKNEYRLIQLNKKNARKAISQPANIDGDFASNKFKFKDDAIDYLINEMDAKQTGYIDPIQIQIICSNLEKEMVIGKGKREIAKSDIGDLKNIIEKFYKEKWKDLREKVDLSDEEFDNVKRKYFNKLVVKGRRTLVNENVLIIDKIDSKIVNELENKGLLVRKLINRNTYFELCHDRMIAPMVKDLVEIELKNKQEKLSNDQKKRRRITWVSLAIVIMALGSVALVNYIRSTNFEKEADKRKKIDLVKQEEFNIKKDSLQNVLSKYKSKTIGIDSILKDLSSKTTINEVKGRLENLSSLSEADVIIKYEKMRADGDWVINALNDFSSESSVFLDIIKPKKDIGRFKVNTIFHGKHISDSIIDLKIIDPLLKEGIRILDKNIIGYEESNDSLKNKSIEIVYRNKIDLKNELYNNKDYSIRFYSVSSNRDTRNLLLEYFKNNKYNLNVNRSWTHKPSFFAPTSTVLYYSKKNRKKAQELAIELSRITPFTYSIGGGIGISERDKNNTLVVHYREE